MSRQHEQQFDEQQFTDEYPLVNGVAMHAENPDYLHVPPEVIKRHVRPGQFVELGIDSPRFSLHEDATRGMPADRLAVGIPLYGRGFAVSEPYAPTEDAPEVRIPQGNYANLHRLLNEEGWTRLWDDEIKAPWLLAPDRSIVFYDDAESVTLKADWAMEQGFRGVFSWQVAADRLPEVWTEPCRICEGQGERDHGATPTGP